MSKPTAEQALANAARLLEAAEMELTNQPLMERYEELASTWVRMAELLTERERV
ncbi:hypothetical protein LG634_24670 [Streptomyces bambusae]|uniref:hypothetical protein n=1 Tax=Streptomyces bambusae TaxID=1550616 RepID=UPI001CFF4352|nr:hypothetical protein [Streptomyces bambusae]MCB5168008.1 hypothetical protein [Streptomyces bambusae]